ncbi:dimethylsulfide dehydrogenase [Marinobacter fuscus]|uniref:Dimethylsulfide dehydrogenase n=1 Tax=Marinobacter fuscus TaxID=2109942 RepID=A0A2T1KPZ4_9GAMM|nr:ethylbenzene dehydrogenase-related protein [Marinobacter fuscus]PSF12216.1 dimethylsulfide dehydrogenase [Marinobacter fuscus]
MKRSFPTTTFAVLGLMMSVAGTAAADHSERNPNVTEVNPGDTVKVARIPDNIYLRTQDDPDDLIWDRLPVYRTGLTTAPPVHPSVMLRFDPTDMEAKHLYFQVAKSKDRFYIRLRWKDASEDRSTTVDQFRDGVAVQYAIAGPETSYMMGSGPDNPVNIWYWRSDQEQIENLAAGGFGSTTHLPEQTVTGASEYFPEEIAQDSEWHVVMSRLIDEDGEHQVDLSRDTIPVVFALWEGHHNERDGNKKVTHNWIMLDNSDSQ